MFGLALLASGGTLYVLVLCSKLAASVGADASADAVLAALGVSEGADGGGTKK